MSKNEIPSGGRVASKGGLKANILRSCGRRALQIGLPAAGLLGLSAPAYAINLYNGASAGNNLEVTLGITASYSGFYRVGSPSATLTSGTLNPNGNDGDANLRHGVVGNEFEVLPVLDIKDGTFGMHFSGEYFLNTVYLQGNQNNQNSTVNPIVAQPTDFASETRQANGNNGRMLDAFVYDNFGFGQGQSITVKVGKQTLFWGQSLFYGSNGISGGQAPIDVIAAQDLVNPQSQQIFLPVGQAVLTYQPNSTYTFQGYYQFEWEPDSLQGVGSYFSTSDVVGPGAQRLIIAPSTYLFSSKPLTPPSQNGQFGLSGQAQYGNYDVGLFGLRFDAKAPTVYTKITGLSVTPNGYSLGNFNEVYGRDIWLYGTSVSTTIGATNVAAEISTRTHMPLAGAAAPVLPGGNPGNANSDPLYPVGNTMTALASFVYGSPALKFDPGGITLLGEVEYVDVYRVTGNKSALAPGRSSSASAFDVEAEPAYFDVLPNLELQFPVSLSYNYAGNSEMDSTMNHGTGSYTAGIVATYFTSWDASLSYVGFFGKPTNVSYTPNAAMNVDRSYLTLNLQHTF